MGLDLDWAGFSLRPTVSAAFITVQDLAGAGLGVFGDPRLQRLGTSFGFDLGRSFEIADLPLQADGSISWRRRFTLNDAPSAAGATLLLQKLGRASCRERVCQYV